MIVGDYCRKSDETNNECLSGFYARKISEYLTNANYSLSQCYKTCIVKIYEKGLGVGTWGQDKKILQLMHLARGFTPVYFTDVLIQEIESLKPSVIVALGEYPLQIICEKYGITNYRGSVLHLGPKFQAKLSEPLRNIKVVIAQHPSIEHAQEEQKFLLRMDFEKAVELLFNPSKKIDDHEILICRSTNEYFRWRGQYPDNPEWMTTDLESHYGFITCASFSFDGRRGLCIPLAGSAYDQMEKARLMYYLAKDLSNPLIKKNNQNIDYDAHIYNRFGYAVANIKWDTLLAASVISPEFPKRLGFLTSVYCDGAYHKDEGKEFDPAKHSFDQLYEYCAKDSIKTHQIMDKQRTDLVDLEALEFFELMIMERWFPMYYQVSCKGILQDTAKQRQLLAKYSSLRDLKALELLAITGLPTLNLDSPTQIGKWMEANELPVLRHRVDSGFMAVNTDGESMKKMRSLEPSAYKKCKVTYEQALRFINLILLIRRIDKVIEYVEVGVHPDGRIRTSVKIGGTSSGRTSNGKTADQVWEFSTDKKTGKEILERRNLGNSLQTVTKHGFIVEGEDDEEIEDGIIGKDVREMYIPDKEWVLIEFDRSQAEARVVDLLAEDYDGLEEYGKIDKHSKNAAVIYPEFTYERIRSMYKSGDPEGEYMRQIGKKAVHATNYDMGAYRFSNMANIDIQFAAQCLKKVHAAKPWIRDVFHRGVNNELMKSRRLDNPVGRPRMFYKKLDVHGIKVGYSWYPQSTISDTTKIAMWKTWDEVDRLKTYLVAENHDSITALVHRTYIRAYCLIIKKHLEESIDFRKGTFHRDYQLVIPCEGYISRRNWGSMGEIKKWNLKKEPRLQLTLS